MFSFFLDDIPMKPGDEANISTELHHLNSISEDTEEAPPTNFTPRSASIRGKEAMAKNLQKLGIGKKQKNKTVNPGAEKSSGGDKKWKGVKSPLAANGEIVDSTDSPQGNKRRSTVENGDGHTSDSATESLDAFNAITMQTPTSMKISEIDEKPMMQVSSV